MFHSTFRNICWNFISVEICFHYIFRILFFSSLSLCVRVFSFWFSCRNCRNVVRIHYVLLLRLQWNNVLKHFLYLFDAALKISLSAQHPNMSTNGFTDHHHHHHQIFSYTKIVRKRQYHDKILYNSNDKMNRERNILRFFWLFCIESKLSLSAIEQCKMCFAGMEKKGFDAWNLIGFYKSDAFEIFIASLFSSIFLAHLGHSTLCHRLIRARLLF